MVKVRKQSILILLEDNEEHPLPGVHQLTEHVLYFEKFETDIYTKVKDYSSYESILDRCPFHAKISVP